MASFQGSVRAYAAIVDPDWWQNDLGQDDYGRAIRYEFAARCCAAGHHVRREVPITVSFQHFSQ
jgi:hypothetical protein